MLIQMEELENIFKEAAEIKLCYHNSYVCAIVCNSPYYIITKEGDDEIWKLFRIQGMLEFYEDNYLRQIDRNWWRRRYDHVNIEVLFADSKISSTLKKIILFNLDKFR